ncbi:MAG: hypothetical protein GY771_00590 [bacterium]|nr:hypothetical protein [bacterium]
MLRVNRILPLLVIAVALTALPALAGYHSESGYISGVSDSNEFSLFANATLIELEFDYPAGADFWVTVYGMYGDLLGDFQLSEGPVIELTGGGEFSIMVTSESGSGSWTCDWYDDGSSSTAGGSYYTESGNISSTNDTEEFGIDLNSTAVDVTFDYPVGADFWVTVYGMDHNHLGTFRLDDGEVIELTGGGQFYLEVYSKSGTGAWSCEWYDN